MKPIESLQVVDLVAHPVWRFINDDSAGETMVHAVTALPVATLAGALVGTQVRLADGTQAWALLSNLDPENPRATEHFLTVSIERDGRWFHLSRYHDPDYAERGPDALARFLGRGVDEVFPISFDVRGLAKGDPAVLTGSVPKEPRERLSRAELIALAVP